MKHIIPLLAIILLGTTSCRKIKNRERIVYGQIVDSANIPIQNTNFSLFVTKYKGFASKKESADNFNFTTDNSGNFRVTFKADKNNNAYIVYPFGNPMEGSEHYWYSVTDGSTFEYNTGTIKAKRRQ